MTRSPTGRMSLMTSRGSGAIATTAMRARESEVDLANPRDGIGGFRRAAQCLVRRRPYDCHAEVMRKLFCAYLPTTTMHRRGLSRTPYRLRALRQHTRYGSRLGHRVPPRPSKRVADWKAAGSLDRLQETKMGRPPKVHTAGTGFRAARGSGAKDAMRLDMLAAELVEGWQWAS